MLFIVCAYSAHHVICVIWLELLLRVVPSLANSYLF